MATEGRVYDEVNETCLEWMTETRPANEGAYSYLQIADLANTINRRLKPLLAAVQVERQAEGAGDEEGS